MHGPYITWYLFGVKTVKPNIMDPQDESLERYADLLAVCN